jgi:hypothetical protein
MPLKENPQTLDDLPFRYKTDWVSLEIARDISPEDLAFWKARIIEVFDYLTKKIQPSNTQSDQK